MRPSSTGSLPRRTRLQRRHSRRRCVAVGPRHVRRSRKARRMSALMRGFTPWSAVYGPLLQAGTALLLGDTDTARVLYLDARARLTPDLAHSALEDFLAEINVELTRRSADGIASVALSTAEMHVLQYL